jgi:hypothetical protein
MKLLTRVDATDRARQAIGVNEAATERVEHVAPERLIELPKVS